MNNYNTPKETIEELILIWEQKVNKPIIATLILSFLAWAYIWFWAQIATVVWTWSQDILWFGLTKILMWWVFSVALMMVIIAWAELFTWNNLIVNALMQKKVTWKQLWKNWIIVFFANFIWAVFIAFLVYKANLWTMSDNNLWLTALKIANDKVNLDFIEALTRWILCNWLVCLAVVMAISAKDTVWKIFWIFFPIMTFVACWFEHSIANMFFIPMWIFLKEQSILILNSWLDLSNLTWINFVSSNLIPVTIWNIIWWSIFVWMLYSLAYIKK